MSIIPIDTFYLSYNNSLIDNLEDNKIWKI